MPNKWKLVVVGMITAFLASMAVTSADALTFATVSGSHTVRSIVGIPVYTCGVAGDYYYDSARNQSGWSGARPVMATHYVGWSFNGAGASWVSKSARSSQVRGWATFHYGLNTQWVKLYIQSYYDEQNVVLKS